MVSGRETGVIFARARALIVSVALVLGCAFLLFRDHSGAKSSQTPSHLGPDQIRAAFGRLPMSFEQNQGQADSSVRFLARGNGFGLYLSADQASLGFAGTSAVQMKLAGANPNTQVAGAEPLPGHSNYFIGNDPSRWHRNVPQYGRVVYREVYPGVDLAFYGNQGRLEYDFDVAPGADPKLIQLDLTGADQLKIDENGDLVLTKDSRELRFQKPRVYQNSSNGPQTVSGSFILRADNRVSFRVGDYDRTRTLVIDPVLSFASYLGGSLAESCGVIVNASQTAPIAHCPAIAVDGSQRVYVAGSTLSSNFPGGTAVNGGADVFVVRFNPAGTALDYTMFVGGSGTEYPVGVAVDSGLNVYVAGTTDSGNFPTTTGAFQTTPVTAGNHAFVTKVDSSGSAILYSTYLSGTNGNEIASGMALDSLARVYVMGITTSTNTASTAAFPATIGSLQSCPGETTGGTCPTPPASQFFFSKVDPSQIGSLSLPYSTYIGGSTPGNAALQGGAVGVDTNFNVYLAGGTAFTDMPIVNAFQSANGGGRDAWVAKLNAPANNTQQYTAAYETYLGAGGNEVAYAIATDGTETYVTGTADTGGITTVPAVVANTIFPQAFGGGATDGFIAKFGVPTVTGTTQGTVPLQYFTYLGGNGSDAGLGIAAGPNQIAYVSGWTNSGNFLNTTPLTPGGGADAFVARIWTTSTSTAPSAGASSTSSTSILGGSGADIGTSVALDSALNVYVAGDTNSGNFPSPSSLPAGGGTDAFVAKLGPSIALTFTCSGAACTGATNPQVSPNPVGVGSQVKFTYTIYNPGDPITGAVFTDNFGANATFVSSSTGTSCTTPSSGVVVCPMGSIPTSASDTSATTVTITVTAPTTAPAGTQISNSATLSVTGTNFQVSSLPQSATVSDFSVAIAPPSAATVIAGGVATFQAVVTPTPPGFPGSVSLACALPTGLTGAGCTFTNNPIPNLLNGKQSRTFEVTTTARVTTPASRFQRGPTYALWLPIFGAGLLGAGITRKRRILLGAFLVTLFGIALLQAGCSSGGSSGSSTSGTPAGTYTIVVNATAGQTRSTSVQLTVE